MTQFSPFAGSQAFLGGLGQGVDLRQSAERLRLQQQAQAIAQQQAAADDAMRWQQFQALEAQRQVGNQQWQAEQQRLQQQNAAQQAYQQATLGQRMAEEQYRQQQDQRQRQDLEAQRGNVAAYRSNLGVQQPGMQGPMPVDFGALPAGVQSFDIQSAMRKQADDAERARRWSGYENFSNKGLWKQATGSFVEKAVEDGYPVPDDVKEANGLLLDDPMLGAMGVPQGARQQFVGRPMDADAGRAIGAIQRGLPDAQQFKTGSRVVKTPAGEAFTLPTGGGAPLVWDDGDPAVHAIKQAAAAWESPRLDRSWWNPKPDEEEAAYEQRVNIRARDLAAGLGWRVQAPGAAAPLAPGSSAPPAGAGVRPPNRYDPTVTGAEAAAGGGDIQGQIRAMAAQGMTRDQIKQKLREMGVGN